MPPFFPPPFYSPWQVPPVPNTGMPPSPFLAGGAGLPPPPVDVQALLGPEQEGTELGEAIDPGTGQPIGGWNKARSVAGPAAGLIGLLALAGGKKNLAAGALGFGRAAEGGWQRDVHKYERLKEREDLEAADWARKKRDELDQLALDDPKYAQLKQVRSDLTKSLAERKLRPSMLKKYQQLLGAQAELVQEARETTELGREERRFLKRAELELRAEREKAIQKYVQAGMPREIAESTYGEDLTLQLEGDRKRLKDIATSPSAREKFEQDARQFGVSQALQMARMAQDERQFGARMGQDESQFQRSQALSRELEKGRMARYNPQGGSLGFNPLGAPPVPLGAGDYIYTPDGKEWKRVRMKDGE